MTVQTLVGIRGRPAFGLTFLMLSHNKPLAATPTPHSNVNVQVSDLLLSAHVYEYSINNIFILKYLYGVTI